MADLFCTFLDLRSLTTNYKLRLNLPCKHYYSSAPHSHLSRNSIIKRGPLHFTLLCLPSSRIDIISTHKHPDGSFLFRFGDPSEVPKINNIEESKNVEEEIGEERKNVPNVLTVVEGDNVAEVLVEKADIEVIAATEVADHSNSVVSSSKSVSVVEGEIELCEKLGLNEVYEYSSALKSSLLDESSTVESEIAIVESSQKEAVDIEHVVDVEEGLDEEKETSTLESSLLDENSKVESDIAIVESLEKETADITSSPDVDIEHVGNVEEGLDEEQETTALESSSLDESSKLERDISTVLSSEKKTVEVTSTPCIDIEHVGDVEEDLDEEQKTSALESYLLDESSKVEGDISTVESSQKKTVEVTSTPDIDIVNVGIVEEGLDEEQETSALESSLPDESSKVESDSSTVESSQKNTVEITSTPDIDIEHVGIAEEGLDDEQAETSTENATMHDESPDVENNTTKLKISENETAEVTTITDPDIAVPEDGVLLEGLETVDTTGASPISDIDLVSLSPESESAMSLSKDIEEQNEMQKVAIGESSEGDMNDSEALEMQYAKGNGNASDTSDAEAKPLPLEAAMVSETQTSGVESGMPNETVGYASANDTIQLMTMPPRLETDSILEEEVGIETGEESREYDGPETTKVGGDLVEASVDEAPVFESAPVSQEMLTTNFVLSSGAALLPHPSKALTGGEDAYFIAGQTWLGVADGVGLWSLEGTNPGVYAQELIKNCEKLISVDNGDLINDPMKLLNLSVSVTDSPGSSTVLIAQCDGQALNVANVGDSGFLILRDGSIFMRSSPMHHVFHFPLQIERGDSPSSLAEFYKVDLENEDVIVTATDGLLDNLYDQEISSIVMNSLAADKTLEEIAELLAMKAQEIGNSASVRTPFSDNAQSAGFSGYSGSKLDDVAVIVSVVKMR